MSTKPKQPARHRLAFFVLLAVYPVVTLLAYGLGGVTAGWQPWERNLVTVPIIVAAMVWVIIPRIHRHLGHLL